MLLDLDLPQRNGHVFLADIGKKAHLKNIPVVILSSSIDPNDRERAFSGGANEYIIKPSDLDGYEGHSLSMLKRIAEALDKRVEIRFLPAKRLRPS